MDTSTKLPGVKSVTRRYVFFKSTHNYNVYRELDQSGKPLPDGLPKDTYFMDCRATLYLPAVIHGSAVGHITVTVQGD